MSWSQDVVINDQTNTVNLQNHGNVAMTNNWAIVGIGSPEGGTRRGSALVYKYENNTWVQKQRLTAEGDIRNYMDFGYAVSITDSFAFVSAPSSKTQSQKGEVYVFKLNNGTWTRHSKLEPEASAGVENGDMFGYDIEVSNTTLIIGCPWYDYGGMTESGAFFVSDYDSNTDTWSTPALNTDYSSLVTASLSIGRSVSIYGDYACIGTGGQLGKVFNYKRVNGTWQSMGNNYVFDGNDCAVGENYLLIGFYFSTQPGGGFNSGQAHIYEKTENGWENPVRLTGPGGILDAFGDGLDINDSYAIVGAYTHTISNRNGGVCIFQRGQGNTWTNVTSGNGGVIEGSEINYAMFGRSVAMTPNGSYFIGNQGGSAKPAIIFKNASITHSTDTITHATSSSSGEDAEQAATNSGISNANVTTLKNVNFGTVTSGKAGVDNSTKTLLSTIFATVGITTSQKRSRRRSALKLLFAQNANVKKMVIPKSDLSLPTAFKKEKALVIKAGETFQISDLENDEGFYVVLNDGEEIKLTTENTTFTFTRNDDINDNERYEVTADSWDDIVINTDDVSTGDFSSSNKSGTLAPDDIVALDGRKFLISSVGDGGSSGSGADPYVFPIKSNIPVKLPNKPAVYRMFEQGDNYVNVEVAKASNEHKERMYQYAKNLTPVTHNIVMDGYFYKKAFISAEGHTFTIDYSTKKANCDEEASKFFTLKQCKKLFDCGEFKEDAMCWTISWNTKDNEKMKVEVMFFPNPHIENGINVIPSTFKKSTGLIVDNYKPKLMELPELNTEKYSKLHRKLNKCKNKFQNMSIKGKNEKWSFN